MQRGDPALVHRVGVRAILGEINDDLALRNPIRVVGKRTPVRGVMERFSSPSITSSNVRALSYYELGELSMMRGSREMQRRVARVHIVMNHRQEVRLRILAGRCDADWPDRETRRFVYPSHDPPVITRGDSAEEREQRGVVGAVELSTYLRHLHRLPDPTRRRLPFVRYPDTESTAMQCNMRQHVEPLGLRVSQTAGRAPRQARAGYPTCTRPRVCKTSSAGVFPAPDRHGMARSQDRRRLGGRRDGPGTTEMGAEDSGFRGEALHLRSSGEASFPIEIWR